MIYQNKSLKKIYQMLRLMNSGNLTSDYILEKLESNRFFEIAYLLKGFSLALLKQLKLINSELNRRFSCVG